MHGESITTMLIYFTQSFKQIDSKCDIDAIPGPILTLKPANYFKNVN